MWQTQWEKPKKGEKDLGPRGLPIPSRRARAAKESPPTPPRPHGQTTGLSRIPKEWRTAEIITFTTNALDHAADPTTARSGRMGGCVMPPQPPQVTGGHSGCHRPRGCLVSEGESQSHQSHSRRQTELGRPGRPQVGGDFSRVPPAPEAPPPKKGSGSSQGTPEGRKHPFPPHPPRQWEEPPGKGRSKGGQNRQGKQQAQGQTTRGSDKGHTETSGGTSPTFPWMQDTPERLRLRLRDATSGAGVDEADPNPAVRWEG